MGCGRNKQDLVNSNKGKWMWSRWGEKSQLEVIATHGYNKCTVVCHICKLDPELHGNAIYNISDSLLRKGGMPCGCGGLVKWTKEQYDILCNRKAQEKGYEYKGMVDKFKHGRTKIRLYCKLHKHEWKSTDINRFLNSDSGCTLCKLDYIGTIKRKSDEDMIARFKRARAFPEGTEIWRDFNERDSRGNQTKWYYKCGICSNDEFVQSGLCSGVFETNAGTLARGCRTCRCGRATRWTKEQTEYKIRKAIEENNRDFKFIGWENDFVNVSSFALFKCEEHGEFPLTVHSIVHGTGVCPDCCTAKFRKEKPAVIYVIHAESKVGEFVGYGITNNFKKRICAHKLALKEHEFRIEKIETFATTGHLAFKIEQKLKQIFPKNSQDMEGFRREATYVKHLNDLLLFVQTQIEKYSGIENDSLDSADLKQAWNLPKSTSSLEQTYSEISTSLS